MHVRISPIKMVIISNFKSMLHHLFLPLLKQRSQICLWCAINAKISHLKLSELGKNAKEVAFTRTGEKALP